MTRSTHYDPTDIIEVYVGDQQYRVGQFELVEIGGTKYFVFGYDYDNLCIGVTAAEWSDWGASTDSVGVNFSVLKRYPTGWFYQKNE